MDVAQADDQNEPEEIIQYLPPRFRDIAASSAAMERFNLMNDDLISIRILPALHSRLHPLILNAGLPGPNTNILRRSVIRPWPPPPSNCSLLIRVMERNIPDVNELNFIDCAIRDKRLPRFPNQVLKRRALIFPERVPNSENLDSDQEPFVEAIGHKVVFWAGYNPNRPFTYIMNSENNGDSWVFRPLDTSRICHEIQSGRFNTPAYVLCKLSVVEHRLIVLLRLNYRSGQSTTHTLCLDVNTETWSLLPQCPLDHIRYLTVIPWQGNLYLLKNGFYRDNVVPIHLDIERNMWVQHDVNPLTVLSVRFFHSSDQNRYIISSRSGTLYALCCNQDNHQYPILHIYAMDDLSIGWGLVNLRKSAYTKQFHPLALPPLPAYILERSVVKKVEWWPVNERDILLVCLQYCGVVGWARYSWWIFNDKDGLKYHNCEELSNLSSLQNDVNLSVFKMEW